MAMAARHHGQAGGSHRGLDITFGGVPAGVTDNDGFLGQVLADNGVVGARYFYFDHVSKSDAPQKPEFRFDGRLDLLSLSDAPGVLNNIDPIALQMRFNGFLNTQRDRDGMLRRVPLLIQHRGVVYPHLSLATFLRSQGLDSATISQDRYGPVIQAPCHSYRQTRIFSAAFQWTA